MIKAGILSTLAFLGTLAISCLDPYSPPPTNQQTDFLVIDGHINSTQNEITVKIGKSVSLQDTIPYPKVSGATVLAEDENGRSLLLGESQTGIYTANYNFDETLHYRLKISAGGREYQSSLIELESSAPIDSLTWSVDGTGLEINANTQDPSEGHKYYRYSYDETYEYNSNYSSSYIYSKPFPVYRNEVDQIYTCWITKSSTNIIVTSTENFTQNKISNFTLVKIPRGDRRLWRQHSLLVRQYSINKETYDYWSQLSKITESLGGLFDPLPYQLKGNLHSTSNTDEIVLGYFSGGSVNEKRIVIGNNQLPPNYSGILFRDCTELYVPNSQLSTLDGKDILLTRPEMMGIFIIGFYYSSLGCVDCHLEGGTNVKPDFMN